jgi:hypothetical protein
MGRGGPTMLGHRGVGPSNRDHPDLARVRNPSPRQLTPGLAALGVPTIKARLQKPPPWTALREASKPAQYPPPYRGRGPYPCLGTALGQASKQPTGPALGCAHGDKRRGYRWDVSDLWRSGLRAAADRTGGVDVLPLRGPIRGPAWNTPATSAPGGSTARRPGAHRRRRARDRSGRNPPAPGRAQPSSEVTRKRAAVSGGRPRSVTVPIAPGSARRGTGTASALVTPTG